MARTPLFRALERCLRLAWSAEQTETETIEHLERSWAEWRASRRRFLEVSWKAAALAALPAIENGCEKETPPAGPKVRVGIVGAGMAGLHCAWRLKKAGIRAQILEAAHRVGGRMFTVRGRFRDGQVAELGGELIDTNHQAIRGLAAELQIPLDDLLQNEPPTLIRDLWHVGGRAVPEAEIVAKFRPLASRMAEAVEAADESSEECTRLDHMNIVQWLDAFPETDPTLRSLLLAAYTGEYGLEAEEQSALNLLYMIDYETVEPFRIFGDSDERSHVHTGNDTLVTRLAEELAGQIHLGARLVSMASLPAGGYRLTFDREAATEERDFDHVVLALPFTMLREVELGLELPEKKLRVIRELGYGTNAKLMGQFASRVWRERHNSSGSVLTDNGLQTLWETSRGQSGASGLLTNFVGGRAGLSLGEGTPDQRMRAALPKIDRIFPGISDAYLASSAIRMHWPTSPLHRGSYACYRPGQWAFHGLEGERVGNLHFCGEHCSLDFQGFMEGACETGAKVAQEILEELGMHARSSARLARGESRQPAWA